MSDYKRLAEAYDHLKAHKHVVNKGDMAQKLGYHRSYLSELMNGKYDITTEVEAKLFRIFNINEDWWRGDDESPVFSNTANEQGVDYITDKKKGKKNSLTDMIDKFTAFLMLDVEWREGLDKEVKKHIKGIRDAARKQENKEEGQ